MGLLVMQDLLVLKDNKVLQDPLGHQEIKDLKDQEVIMVIQEIREDLVLQVPWDHQEVQVHLVH